MIEKTLIYLACPYSHPDRSMRERRFVCVNIVAAKLMGEGHHIFSPISHTHPIAEARSLPQGWEFWEGFDRAFIIHCKKMIVLKLDGWEASVGVQAEIKIAEELGIPVEYMEFASVYE